MLGARRLPGLLLALPLVACAPVVKWVDLDGTRYADADLNYLHRRNVDQLRSLNERLTAARIPPAVVGGVTWSSAFFDYYDNKPVLSVHAQGFRATQGTSRYERAAECLVRHVPTLLACVQGASLLGPDRGFRFVNLNLHTDHPDARETLAALLFSGLSSEVWARREIYRVYIPTEVAQRYVRHQVDVSDLFDGSIALVNWERIRVARVLRQPN